jgi:hypothetical protein
MVADIQPLPYAGANVVPPSRPINIFVTNQSVTRLSKERGNPVESTISVWFDKFDEWAIELIGHGKDPG